MVTRKAPASRKIRGQAECGRYRGKARSPVRTLMQTDAPLILSARCGCRRCGRGSSRGKFQLVGD